MALFNLFPDARYDSVYEIDLNTLRERGIRGLIFDIDNTITAWGVDALSPEMDEHLQIIESEGFQVAFISNASAHERKGLAEPLARFHVVFDAAKPLSYGFRELIERIGFRPNELAMVGDQIFTDILGANRAGMYTILVKPVGPDIKSLGVKLRRILEKVVLFFYRFQQIADRS